MNYIKVKAGFLINWVNSKLKMSWLTEKRKHIRISIVAFLAILNHNPHRKNKLTQITVDQ